MSALGFGSDDTIFEIFGDSETLRNTIEKDLHKMQVILEQKKD